MKEERNYMETTRESRELRESDLIDVTGGDGKGTCYFVHKQGGKIRNINGRIEAECGSNCAGGLVYCSCHNHPDGVCIDRWHMVTENGSPLPRHFKGHDHWYA